MTVDSTTGAVSAVTYDAYRNDFKIKVCARNLIAGDANDCVTSSS